MTSGRARVVFGLLAGWSVAVSAGALGMTAVAVGAPAGGPVAGTTAPAVSAPPVAPSVALTPCSPRRDGSCSLSPQTLAVTYPSSSPPPASGGVNVTSTTTGRPAGTGPAQPSGFLSTPSGRCTPGAHGTTCTWPWPPALEAPRSTVVLNGAYQAASCTGPAAAGCGPPSNLLIAAPPAPPGGARASGSSSVTVTWAPGVEPDLAGYTVTRNNVVVFTCNVHAAPLPGSVPCGSPLAYTDSRATGGAVTYGIVAQRFGLDSNPAHYLTSRPAVASITLGAASLGKLPLLPVIGIPSFPKPVAPPNPPATAGSTLAPPTTVDPSSGGFEFGPKDHAGALGPVRTVRAGPVTTSVTRLALIAAGLLVLALAAHLLYLRGAVARYQAAHGGPTTRAVHRRRKAPMRIQWGQWPPLIRDEGRLSSPG
ncbi:MAG: hypothetical protein M3Y91_04945 [Actinomycetota bacterium]|nr:hypothetical protein [Actinomycetota bacterium]